MAKKFTDFVNGLNEQAKEKKKEFNPQERIDKFVSLVNSLYATIDEWLKENIADGSITTDVEQVTIMEERLGPYKVNSKWIQIGEARFIFEPRGTIMIGTNARIDMRYKTQTVMIVRTGENVEGPGDLITIEVNGEIAHKPAPAGKPVWKYVKDRHRLSYVTLTKESFEKLIMDLVNETR